VARWISALIGMESVVAAHRIWLPPPGLVRIRTQTRRCGKKKTITSPSTSSVEPIQTTTAPRSRATISPVYWRVRSKVYGVPALVVGLPWSQHGSTSARPTAQAIVSDGTATRRPVTTAGTMRT
jgi:hypothetical protein